MPSRELTRTFQAPGMGTTFYPLGAYIHGSTSFTPSATPQNLGTANNPYGAHAFLVLGATSADMVVRVTGTSITDTGTRTAGDTESINTSGGALNAYYQTTKRWIGTIAYTLLSGTGVAVNNGMVHAWRNQGIALTLSEIEIEGRGAAADTAFDVLLIHHQAAGWTYNAGSSATHPTAVASLATDLSTESDLAFGQQFRWLRTGLSEAVPANGVDGVIVKVVTGAGDSVLFGNVTLRWT